MEGGAHAYADAMLVHSNLVGWPPSRHPCHLLLPHLQGDILTALDLSRATFRCIRRNYGWALGYNLCMIPLAAGALYPSLRWQLPPWLAGAAMAFSSLSVLGSSLLLRRYRPPREAAAPPRLVVVDAAAGAGA